MLKKLNSINIFLLVLLQIHLYVNYADGHGRLLEPISRASAWRKDPVRFPAFYDDTQMFCGGFDTQWKRNGGKCGICGESWSAVKQFEKGGKMYRGINVQSYTQGQLIKAVVELTANHKGYFEFRICDVDSLPGDATQECLDQNLLTDVNGNTQIPVTIQGAGVQPVYLRLPSGLTCNHCVLQWKYNAQNSWGTDPNTGQSCVGCGPQEQFYACSDVSVSGGQGMKREFMKKTLLRKLIELLKLQNENDDLETNGNEWEIDNENREKINNDEFRNREIDSMWK